MKIFKLFPNTLEIVRYNESSLLNLLLGVH